MRERKRAIIAMTTVVLGILFIMGLIYGTDIVEFLEGSESHGTSQLVCGMTISPVFTGMVFGIMYLWGVEFKRKS